MKHDGKKVILVDMDDTIEDFSSVWIESLNKIYGGNYSTDDIHDWEISNIYPNLTKQEKLEPLHKSGFWKKVKPLPGAVEYLKKLQDEGFDVFIVTATDYRTVKAKVEHVLNRYFPFIDSRHFITTHYKSLLKADILVDDHIQNLVYGDYEKILFTANHNKDFDDVFPRTNIYRVDNWEECYIMIHRVLGVKRSMKW